VTFLHKLTNFLLYSSVFISIGTVALIQLNIELVSGNRQVDAYTWFAFFATILLYSAHRIIGIKKVRAFEDEPRFGLVKEYHQHIFIFGLIGAFGAAICFILVLVPIKLLIIAPAVFSLLYVIPVFPGKKRLRDYSIIKIFTIAFVWAWITSFIPEYIALGTFDVHQFLSFSERFLFFIAITIPFDIRDFEVDIHLGVKTIPSLLGVNRSKFLALSCLLAHLCIVLFLSNTGYYQTAIWVPYLVLFIVTGTLIYQSNIAWSDYYYSGLLDGMIILQWLLVSSWLAIHG
jgi:4-hydroxybenzoate polyprenyltransferase